MARTINEVMTHDPRTVPADATLTEVARVMRDADVGAIVVERGGRAAGILSLGELAVEGDADAELTDISAASPNN